MRNNNLINPLEPPIYAEKFLRFRHAGLIIFQIAGVIMLVYVCFSLFGNTTEDSTTSATSTDSITDKFTPIVFLVVWNIAAFLMIRASSKTLLQLKQAKEVEQGGHGDAEEAV